MKIILEKEELDSSIITGQSAEDSPDLSYMNGDRLPDITPDDIKSVFSSADDVSATPVDNSSLNNKQPLKTKEIPLKSNYNSTDDYSEIADQLYNLVNNKKETENAFKDILRREDRNELETWFNDNVKSSELSDLFTEDQSVDGFLSWILLHPDYFLDKKELTMSSIDSSSNYLKNKIDKEINNQAENIKSEDSKLMHDTDGETDGSDEDDMDGSDEDDMEDTSSGNHKIPYKKKHILNKVILKIDDDEASDRASHEKYYILKKNNIENFSNLNELENKLDGKNISYYDFKNCSCKIYDSNEVELNRIFESLDLDVRCIDIRHYTENEIKSNKIKADATRLKNKTEKQSSEVSSKNYTNKKQTEKIYYMDNATFKYFVQLVQNLQYYYLPYKFTVTITNTNGVSTLEISITFNKKPKNAKSNKTYADNISTTDNENTATNVIKKLKNILNSSVIMTR